MQLLRARFVLPALSAGVVIAAAVAVPAGTAGSAPRASAAVASPGASAAGVQGCAITPHRVTKRGAIKGKVTTKNCRGWTVWYGMQVHRWHGWTRIAGRDDFVGSSGTKTYTVKACKKGTFNYRMYVARNGGLPRAVTTRHSASVRRTC